MLLRTGVLLCTLLAKSQALTERQEADRIRDLPGLPFSPRFGQFSGYLKAAPNRHLHYWLVESAGDVSADPLIVWLNGGPGCSSLLGLLFENGPFRLNRDAHTLWHNPHSWNLLGNVLYIEGPTGVGFSYSDDFADDVTGDARTAQDFYAALDDFFVGVRPEWSSRGFFLTGESYAGVYIPFLAALLVDGQNSGAFHGRMDGFAIGNGLLSERKQTNSVVDFYYFHGIISSEMWAELRQACCPQTCLAECDFYSHLDLLGADWSAKANKDSACGRLAEKFNKVLADSSQTDVYNVYRNCYQGKTRRREVHASLGAWVDQSAYINLDSTDANGGFECYGQDADVAYLNLPEVQAALNIPPAVTQHPNWNWTACSQHVEDTFSKTSREMGPWFDHIYTQSDVRILIYNGDVDSSCNFLGDEWFMSNFTKTWKVPVLEDRHAWHHRGQIGGYVKRYDRIDVATVKGAGHFVPTSRPGPMLQLLANFMRGFGDYSQPYAPL